MQLSVHWSGTNRIVIRQNGNNGGKTDKYTVNDTQKSSKQQKVANQTEEGKLYENKMRNDSEPMRNAPFLAINDENTMRNAILRFISHSVIYMIYNRLTSFYENMRNENEKSFAGKVKPAKNQGKEPVFVYHIHSSTLPIEI